MTALVTLTVPVRVDTWVMTSTLLKIGLVSPLLTGSRPYTYQNNNGTWAWVGGPANAPLAQNDPLMPVITAVIADAGLQPLLNFLNPPTAPSPPTNVQAVAGVTQATVSWTAPANGGSPITGYAVTPSLNGVTQPVLQMVGSPPAPNATVTGLTTGQPYTFTVTATNAIGTSAASSPSIPVTVN